MIMRIVSVNTGQPQPILWRDRTITTAIFKHPVAGPVRVRRLNLEGDGQADLEVHGGENKAIYAYAAGHYAWWRRELPDAELAWGSFGENLTLDDFNEHDIHIGDVFLAGTARLMAVQPRLPCTKLNLRFRRDDMIDRFLASGRTGVYFKVIEEGVLQAGDIVERTIANASGITIAQATQLYTGASDDPALLRQAVATPALPEAWQRRFGRKLG